jgi:hypothetical protein
MTAGIVSALTAIALGALAVLGLALWRSVRAGTGIWWPLLIAALVLGGLCAAVICLRFA